MQQQQPGPIVTSQAQANRKAYSDGFEKSVGCKMVLIGIMGSTSGYE